MSIRIAMIAALLFATSSANAALVTTPASQTGNPDNTSPNYTVSATDLINGLAASSSTGNFTQEGTGGTPVLTDGTVANPITRNSGGDNDGPFQFSTFATGGTGATSGGTRVEYTLPNTANVNLINVFGGWQDGGRDQQSYTVSYQESGGGNFRTIGTVNFNPTDPAGHPQTTKVTLTESTGLLAHNVKVLRFDFNATENGYSGYDEIDVTGDAQTRQALTNPGFETPVTVGNGNHIGTVPTGWSVNTGNNNAFNLVLDPGNGENGSNQYLDLTNSGTYVFQTFSVGQTSNVYFGGYFSPRDTTPGGGGGFTAIYDSTNTNQLATSPVVSSVTLNSWALSQNLTPLVLSPGTYVFRAFIDDDANVDNVFVMVPEPASLGLLAIGFGCLIARRRRA